LIVVIAIVAIYLAIPRTRIVNLIIRSGVLIAAVAIWVDNWWLVDRHWWLVNRRHVRVHGRAATVQPAIAGIVAVNKFRALLVEIRALSFTIPAPLRRRNGRQGENQRERKQDYGRRIFSHSRYVIHKPPGLDEQPDRFFCLLICRAGRPECNNLCAFMQSAIASDNAKESIEDRTRYRAHQPDIGEWKAKVTDRSP
jgi:hypothetical protein